jgi:hypothetical protein
MSLVFFQNRKIVLAAGEGQTAIIPMPLPSHVTINIDDPQLLHLAPTLAFHLRSPLEHITDGRRVLSTLAAPDGTPWKMGWDGTGNFPMVTIHPVGADGVPIVPA